MIGRKSEYGQNASGFGPSLFQYHIPTGIAGRTWLPQRYTASQSVRIRRTFSWRCTLHARQSKEKKKKECLTPEETPRLQILTILDYSMLEEILERRRERTVRFNFTRMTEFNRCESPDADEGNE